MVRRCRDCGITENLTNHSINGGHKPPFITLCLDCHTKFHDAVSKRKGMKTQKGNLKNVKGTSRRKNR